MKNKKWILGIILILICILLAWTRWTTYEGFKTCYGGQHSVNGVCVCPDGQKLNAASNLCICSDPNQYMKPYTTTCVCSNPNFIVSNLSNTCIPNIVVTNSPVRNDNTCSDKKQRNMYDRFDDAIWADMTRVNTSNTACAYESSNSGLHYDITTYMDNSNLCLPKCPSNYTVYDKDITMCIATSCMNTPDLSSNILNSWRQVCGPLYKTQLDFTSTLQSVSSVTGTLNEQYGTATINVQTLSNNMFMTSNTASDASKQVRTTQWTPILSNYYTLHDSVNVANSNYAGMLSTKSEFGTYYSSFLCDRYY